MSESNGNNTADWSLARPAAHAPGAPLVTIIGDGQLARMTQQAAIELGLSCRVLAGAPDSSAAQVTADVVLGDYALEEHVREVAQDSDAVTFDHEHVPNRFLDALIADGVNVQPQPAALIHAQDKLVMRKKLRELGAPVPAFAAIESADDIAGFFDAVGGQVCLKARRGGYDGKGVWFPATVDEARELVEKLLDKEIPLMAEKKVALVRELSAMVARTPSGEVQAWPAVESLQEDGICVEAVAPAPNSTPEILAAAEQLSRDVATELGVTGVLAVELFETTDENGQPEIIVNELAMRPHNTGHWTQDGCITSQFEQHVRAVLDRPLGSTEPTAPVVVMANVLGAAEDPAMPMHERMDAVWRRFPNAKIHMYGKDWRPRRKIGHVNMLGEDPVRTREQARLAAKFLETAEWEDQPMTENARTPLVGLVMGSDSDWPTVEPAAELLAEFGIPFEVGVVSAHRTPERMLDYARTAHTRGVKVIIACAGGAAHLPGMVAAATPLPVIGIPRALGNLDGLDSLLSIVQMPGGVPTATVSIDGAKNAGLLAVRTLAVADAALMDKMVEYQENMRDAVLEKDRALQQKLMG